MKSAALADILPDSMQPGSDAPPSLSGLTLSDLIDELGEAQRLHCLFKPQVNPHTGRVTAAYRELERRYAKYPAASTDLKRGSHYQLEVTPCEEKHPVTAAIKLKAWKALKKLKIDPLECFSVTLTSLKARLGPAWAKKHIPGERTGPRDFRVVAIEAAKQGGAA